MFRGREVQHPELGEKLLIRLAADLDEAGRIESQPNLDGRNMVMVMAPKKEVTPKAEAKGDAGGEVTEEARSEVATEVRSEPQESAARS